MYLYYGYITLVRSIGNRTRELWRFFEEASRTDIRSAELEHPSINVMLSKCTSRVPIYAHPFFYRSLKLRCTPWMPGEYPGTAELLRNSIPVPCVRPSASSSPEDFWPVVDTE